MRRPSGAAWITATEYSDRRPDSGRRGGHASIPRAWRPAPISDAVAITSNAVAYTGAQGDKTSLTVPVELEIVSAGPPVVDYQGVLDNAIFVPGDAISRGDIVAVKGQQLSMKAPASGTAPAAEYAGGGYAGAAQRRADPALLHVVRPDQLPDSDQCAGGNRHCCR